eukprot:TRINITY_DN7775_c0_g1_i1.p1 TRINITY_DN7775_c0_g1~~TRINITY_DN7775_c0_g1_i1.p1  ORF type:complete len:292 (-),score=43.00 TRINITY_DN7775_c0_g1_i1:1522-2397(-)
MLSIFGFFQRTVCKYVVCSLLILSFITQLINTQQFEDGEVQQQQTTNSGFMMFPPLFGPGFMQGFLKSWGVILVSEIGDKTFFIAAIMAMRNPRITVFAGAMGALAAMTILSAFLGWAAPNLIPRKYTHWAATALFLFFGFRMLWEAYKGGDSAESELEQVEQELAGELPKVGANNSQHGGGKQRSSKSSSLGSSLIILFSPVFLKAFSLTFLAEWGDRSQIATIGLATQSDVWGVTLGGILGHCICTGAAVLGGQHLASYINERTVLFVGGLLFLLFGFHAIYEGIYVVV